MSRPFISINLLIKFISLFLFATVFVVQESFAFTRQHQKPKITTSTKYDTNRIDIAPRIQFSHFFSTANNNHHYDNNQEQSEIATKNDSDNEALTLSNAFDKIINSRYACTRYERFDGIKESTNDIASIPNPSVVEKAMACLDVARRAPTGFNTQPFHIILVSDPQTKQQVAKYCLGHNAHRVRDSDCTAIFLADREVCRQWTNYQKEMLMSSSPGSKWSKNDRSTRMKKLKIFILIALFSSGLPLPRWMAVPITFGFRSCWELVNIIVRDIFPLPTLSSAETWSEKNTMLVVMSYILACTSRGLATSPMEGISAGGIKKVLKIPRRYSIPLIVATGTPYQRNNTSVIDSLPTDDAGISHGPKQLSPRYKLSSVVSSNLFGGIKKE